MDVAGVIERIVAVSVMALTAGGAESGNSETIAGRRTVPQR